MKGRVRKGSGIDSGRDWSGIEEILGYRPYPGTLNVKVEHRIKLEDTVKLFDYFDCAPGEINGQPCHICGKYGITFKGKRALFIVAPVKLREVLAIEDGDTVEVVTK